MILELKHLAHYLPYELMIKTTSSKYKGVYKLIELDTFGFLASDFTLFYKRCKPILLPISDLLEKLDFFEIGDDNNYSIEFDHGNIKLIQHLKAIAENDDYFNIQFLPHIVAKQLIEWHLDIFGLIPAGLAVSIHDVGQVIA